VRGRRLPLVGGEHILCWRGGQPSGLSTGPKRHWELVLAAGSGQSLAYTQH